jgi:uncharacterized surface protein with fasciclin (FAS1) repeats
MPNLFKKTLAAALFVAVLVPFVAHSHKDAEQPGNIVETASGAGQFETLLAAATAADLVPALTGEGPLTVFAPTDDAFGALPAGTIETLLREENRDTLVRILSYHVVAGKVGSDALADSATLKTLAGPQVKFTQTEKGFSVEGARIVATDIAASNGVVHVIDRVIMPPKQMSKTDAEHMIMSAINKGAPMFNHGNHTGTVNVYFMTAKTLLNQAPLTAQQRDRLERGMNTSKQQDSSMERAWELRYALDDVYNSLQSSDAMTTLVR